MGNRANIIFTDESEKSISPCVYLHWNGGPESIYAFLNEMERRHIRIDQNYECARFIGIVTDFFDQDSIGATSIGVVNYPAKKITIKDLNKVNTDTNDNGFYVICRKGKGETKIRRFVETRNENGYALTEMSEEEVIREKGTALKSNYIKDMADTFIKLQGDKKIENYP